MKSQTSGVERIIIVSFQKSKYFGNKLSNQRQIGEWKA